MRPAGAVRHAHRRNALIRTPRTPHDPAQSLLRCGQRRAAEPGAYASAHREGRPRQTGKGPDASSDSSRSRRVKRMSGMWISARPRGWPRHGFQKRGGAIFFGIVAMFAAWFFQVEYQWDGMQRYYLAHYVVSSAGLFQKYLVLHTVDRQGRWHPTVPAEVAPVQMASYTHGAIPFRLSDAALQRGAVRLADPLIPGGAARLASPLTPGDKARFAAFLRDWVYEGQTLTDLAKPGIWWGLGVMVAGLCLAWPQDRKARDILENSRRVRGAELVTRDEFNRKRKYGIGMGFLTLEPRNLRERVWIKYSHGPM